MARKSRAKKRKPNHNILHEELPIRKKGDADPERLREAVGIALTSWEMMDEFQASLFSALVRSRNMAASRAYGVIAAFKTRVDMIRAAADAALPANSDLLADINAYLNDVAELAGKRNNIAHGIITEITVHMNGRSKRSGFYLMPPDYATRKNHTGDRMAELMKLHPKDMQYLKKYAYTSAQVRLLAREFRRYQMKAIQLHTRAISALN